MIGHYAQSRYVTNIVTPKGSKWRSVRLLSWISIAVGLSGSFVTIILLAYLGAQLIPTASQISILCFFSLLINILSAILFVTVLWRSRSDTQSRPFALIYPTIISSAIALVLTLACGIWIQVASQSGALANNITAVSAGLIVVTIMSTTGQAILSVLATFRPQESIQHHEAMMESTNTSRPATSKTHDTAPSNPFASRSGSASPQFSVSAISIPSIPSIPSRKNSRSHSRLSEVSELDFHWDTSGVPAILRDTIHRNLPSKLPPIPGSRPVSPAKALDGPFLPPSPHPNQSQPSSPTEASFLPQIITQTSFLEEAVLHPPQPQFAEVSDQSTTTTSSTPKQISRCSSAVSLVESVSHLTSRTGPEPIEAHIHPLFRSNSPIPAPFASKRTIVTAASVLDAEEIVSNNNRIRPPSRSKPTSPLTRNFEWMFISPESADSLIISPSQQDEHRSTSDIIILPSLPRSSTATSRPRASIDSSAIQITQPSTPTKPTFTDPDASSKESKENSLIPSFILAAGTRYSMLDFEARLAQQQ